MGATLADSSNTQISIAVNNLVIQYNTTTAVKGLSFSVPSGSVFGLLGANGSGKTSTIKALLGILRNYKGQISVLGQDITKSGATLRERIGYVSEVQSLYGYATIAELNRFCERTSTHWNNTIVLEYLNRFGLDARLRIDRLSKGQRSQAAVCLALGNDPDLLILDEPTAGFDPIARHTFLAMITGDLAAAGKTIFLSTHLLTDIESVADRILLIDQGERLLMDELDTIKQTHARYTYMVTLSSHIDIRDTLSNIPGIIYNTVENNILHITYCGSPKRLAEQMNTFFPESKQVSQNYLRLEDIFLAYVKGRNL